MLFIKKKYIQPLNFLYYGFGLICFFSLFLRVFFEFDLETKKLFYEISNVAMFVFLIEESIRLALLGGVKYFNNRKLELTSVVVILCLLIAQYIKGYKFILSPQDLSLLVLGLVSAAILIKTLVNIVSKASFFMNKKLGAHEVIFFSFFISIATGTFLLKLPNATYQGIGWVDALFTATSAVCVTGLSTVSITEVFTPLGLMVLLMLFQVGGLGIMTITMTFATFFAGKLGVGQTVLLKQMFDTGTIHEAKKVFTDVVKYTFFFESLGVLFISYNSYKNHGSLNLSLLFESIFHSVSAFCNAGFSLYENSLNSLNLDTNYLYVSTVMGLIVVGGLGFPVILNLLTLFREFKRKNIRWLLSTHTKLVLTSTLSLLLIGFVGFYVLESQASFSELSGGHKVLQSLFLSVTSRTAGFNLWPTESLSVAGSALLMVLMWVGAAPISTAGGIKCTTLAIALIHMINQLRGKEHCEIFGREISPKSVQRALTVIFGSLLLVFVCFILLLKLNPSLKGLDLIFETFSAWGTVGLSRGVTSDLSEGSKVIVSFMMFCGRVGFFSVFSIFLFEHKSRNRRYLKDHITVY